MITVTPTSRAHLCEMLADRPIHIAVRIVRRKGRLKLRGGTQRPGDEVFKHDGHDGRAMLLLGEDVAEHLENRFVGVHDTEYGPRLRLGRVRDKRRS